MLTPMETHEIRMAVHAEVADIERRTRVCAGSYRFLCAVNGLVFYSHQPVGQVLRRL